MTKKIVYSTNPNWTPEVEDETADLASSAQKLRVRLETKQRAGKKATVIAGWQGSDDGLEDLAKKLKTKLGTGGSHKDGEIIIQGDVKEKVIALLRQFGYPDSK